jgi:hypothetical protein
MAWGPEKPRLAKAIEVMRENLWLQQFGQGSDYSAFDGATACTHVVLQALALIWLGRRLSIDQISALARYYRERNVLGQPRGLNNVEFSTVCLELELPYTVVFGLSASDMVRYSNRGPVSYGMRHGSHPDRRGYVYRGVSARAPYAIRGGQTQLTGFENGRHMDLFLGYRTTETSAGRTNGYRGWTKDPNHGSSARPERPPFDEVTVQQVQREYLDFLKTGANNVYCAIPTRSLPV